jgi:hypothetical protein
MRSCYDFPKLQLALVRFELSLIVRDFHMLSAISIHEHVVIFNNLDWFRLGLNLIQLFRFHLLSFALTSFMHE